MFQDIGTLMSMDLGFSVSVFGLGSVVLFVALRFRLRVKWLRDMDNTMAARRLLDQTTMTDVGVGTDAGVDAAAGEGAADAGVNAAAEDDLEGAVGGEGVTDVQPGSPSVLPTAPTQTVAETDEFGTPKATSSPWKQARHSRRVAQEAPEFKGFD